MNPGGRRRIFLALTLPAGVRRGLAALAFDLDRQVQGGTWVAEANFHLTIRFLGDRDEHEVQQIEAIMREVGDESGAFTMALSGLGAFPGQRRPQVIWIGLERGAEPTVLMEQAVSMRLHKAEIAPPEARGFTPHVTLGRSRSGRGLAAETDFFDTLGPPEARTPFRVESLVLMASALAPSGPKYTVIARAPLTARAR